MEGAARVSTAYSRPPRADFGMVTLQPGLVVCHTLASDLGAIATSKTFDGDSEFIHLNCQLAGMLTGRVGQDPLDFIEGDVSLGFAAGERFQVRHCEHFQNLAVMVKPDVLCELAGEEMPAMLGLRQDPRFFVQRAGICQRSMRSARNVASLLTEFPCQRLLLHAATLDFLHWHLTAFQSCKDCRCLSTRECRQLEHARELLLQDLSTPPTIAQLAKAVGINQCKLKKSFKDHFGNTIYGLFQEERMASAQRLLQSYNVTETAMILGYSNVSHFSAAFAKQFGCLPSKARQSVTVAMHGYETAPTRTLIAPANLSNHSDARELMLA
ncbi:MAG: helix-turn-helix transcriptional regulator [Gammaproteobacteria bacterium]|nr:helix-turn-helix transcriptional regulator [Gammaproteobacteria bacterium]